MAKRKSAAALDGEPPAPALRRSARLEPADVPPSGGAKQKQTKAKAGRAKAKAAAVSNEEDEVCTYAAHSLSVLAWDELADGTHPRGLCGVCTP